ncbi:hypothetical protein ACLB2K_026191 [Fragaria x ananassa]
MDMRTFGLLCELLRTDGRLKNDGLVSVEEQVYGTYVRVRVAAIDKARYQTKKADIATNVLAACSRDMQFTFLLPGWEGSASDSRVLRDALTRPNGLRVPTGYYYLVDGGYTNGEGFLAPYRGTRYHLSEWREGFMPTNKEEYFNMKHAKTRNVIERCFGMENEDMNFEQAKAAGTRRKWTNFEEDALLSDLDDFVTRGLRSETRSFKYGTLLQMEKSLELLCPNSNLKAFPHI